MVALKTIKSPSNAIEFPCDYFSVGIEYTIFLMDTVRQTNILKCSHCFQIVLKIIYLDKNILLFPYMNKKSASFVFNSSSNSKIECLEKKWVGTRVFLKKDAGHF